MILVNLNFKVTLKLVECRAVFVINVPSCDTNVEWEELMNCINLQDTSQNITKTTLG